MEKSAFKRWTDLLQKQKISNTPTTNRFIARFRLASKFDGVKVRGYTEKTLRGYNSLLSVFFSYTAFEAFIEALAENARRKDNKLSVAFSVNKFTHALDKRELAADIWENEKLLQILLDYAEFNIQRDTTQIERLMAFYLEELDGERLHAVARQIRHLVAHGHMTAYGSEAVKKKNTQALFDLAQLIRDETYSLFEQYITKLEVKFADESRKQLNSVPHALG